MGCFEQSWQPARHSESQGGGQDVRPLSWWLCKAGFVALIGRFPFLPERSQLQGGGFRSVFMNMGSLMNILLLLS